MNRSVMPQDPASLPEKIGAAICWRIRAFSERQGLVPRILVAPLLFSVVGGSGGGGYVGQPGSGGGGGVGSGPVTVQLPFDSDPNVSVRVRAQDFGAVVPIQVVLTDSGPKTVVNAEINNTSTNPATVDVPVTVPVNTLVTIHVWKP
jgi:hypothetical protein